MQLGIDIGTQVARAAMLDADGRPKLVTTLPALARQTMHGLLVGDMVAQTLAGNAETTVRGPTRLMGRAGDLPADLLERLPYPVHEVGGEAVCNLLYDQVRASQVYGRLVGGLLERAAQTLGQTVEAIVLTVPAGAEDRFRVQARAAAEAQGVTVGRLLNRPTAALLAAQLPAGARHAAVVNCGGGATDVSVARREDGGARILATAGDMTLGGEDLTWAAAEGLNQRFGRTAGVDVFAADESRVAALGLRAAAEEALQTLCLAPETNLVLDHGGGFGRDLVTVVRRSDVEQWLAGPVGRIGSLCAQALAASGVQGVDAVVLTGDWVHLPPVQEEVARVFEKPVDGLYRENAPLLPVYGAALATAEAPPLVWDVTPYALGINCFYSDVELFSPIIQANTPIPTPSIDGDGAHTRHYQTRFPDQTSVTLDILQYRGSRDPNPYGDSPVYPNGCEVLGSWEFEGLSPKKGQHAKFTVTFAVDADGILHLYAKERATGHDLKAKVDRGIG